MRVLCCCLCEQYPRIYMDMHTHTHTVQICVFIQFEAAPSAHMRHTTATTCVSATHKTPDVRARATTFALICENMRATADSGLLCRRSICSAFWCQRERERERTALLRARMMRLRWHSNNIPTHIRAMRAPQSVRAGNNTHNPLI